METHQGLVQQSLHSSQDINSHTGCSKSCSVTNFFLVIMDWMSFFIDSVRAVDSGVSICHLYLGGAAHADDVRAIVPFMSVAEAQGLMISHHL